MTCIIYLYVEGGDRDGDTFAAGSFGSSNEARKEARRLEGYGQVQILDLQTVDQVLRELEG